MATTQITANHISDLLDDADDLTVLVITADGTADLHAVFTLDPALGWDDNPVEHGDDEAYPSELRDALRITSADVTRTLQVATDARRTPSLDEAAEQLTARANRALAAHQATL